MVVTMFSCCGPPILICSGSYLSAFGRAAGDEEFHKTPGSMPEFITTAGKVAKCFSFCRL